MLEAVENFIASAPPILVFGLIFLASYIENIFPPIPGDTILIFGAYLVGRGNLSFSLALLTTLLGSVLGFMSIYYVGRRYGRGFVFHHQRKWFSPKALERVDRLFNRWGYGVVLMNRFMAGLRSVIALFAGMGHLSWQKVLGLSFISSLFWNGALIWLGARLGKNWELIRQYLKEYNTVVTIVIGLLIIGWIVYRWRIARKPHEEVPPES